MMRIADGMDRRAVRAVRFGKDHVTFASGFWMR